MARTQALDFDEKRDAIMFQAAQLFAQKGFKGASISDLSKACGVSKSLIYHYYGAKEDILFEVMTKHVDELIAVTTDSKLTRGDALEEFQALTQAILKSYVGAENEQKVLLYELNSLKETQRAEIVKKQRSIIRAFEKSYKRIFPELKNDRALLRSKIMLFFGMLNWTHTWFKPSGKISRNKLAKLAANIMTQMPQ